MIKTLKKPNSCTYARGMYDALRNHLNLVLVPFYPLCALFSLPQNIEKRFSIVNTVTSHILLFNHSQIVKARDMKFSKMFTTPYVSCVFCNMSHVTCPLSSVKFRIKKERNKLRSQSVEGLLSMRPTLSFFYFFLLKTC